ncbi:hypothetical protein [Kyrpidia tusciae]|uniref:Uncharacterized protein n=1 Tax=Kyrpidia tusciae (strain DSM 2912 / NBRC 15312 / T2) TaxID=562970 RepID=D5WVE1_KYRT2|nr:hypothetical protein [Kyrpidia tusciae]ADG05551.1 hypothetical protein Btus_0795 [Kyrpidia tusciae DSM 2912]
MKVAEDALDKQAERVCTHKFALAMGRTVRASHPEASPTSRPIRWSADCGQVDELSTGNPKRWAKAFRQPAA